MKKFTILVYTILFITSLNCFGEKADFKTAEKFAPENLRKMVGSRSVVPKWVNGSDIFIYRFKTRNITEYYIVDPQKKEKKLLFNRMLMGKKLSKITGDKPDHKNLLLENIQYDIEQKKFSFIFSKKKYIYSLKKKKLTSERYIPEKKKTFKLLKKSPDGKWVIYSKGHNLYINRNGEDISGEKRLTTNGEKWFSYSNEDGKDDPAELSRTIGEWFPDSKKIFCVRKDKRKVEDLFLVHSLSKPRPTLELYKYAMAGDKNLPQFFISVIDIDTGKITDIDVLKWKNQQIGSEVVKGVYPGDDSSSLYFVRTSRDWRNIELCEADTGTGKVKVLIKETSIPYWNADIQQFRKIGKSGDFVWWSEKSGRGHLYLHDRNGTLLRQITAGEFTVTDILNIDEANKYIYFIAYGKNSSKDPYYRKYYRTGFNGSGLLDLTPEEGTHTIHMSGSMSFFVDTYSTVKNPNISILKDSRGQPLLELEKMDVSKLLSTGWQPPVRFKVKAADNKTDLYGVMWKPFNLKKGRKYPVISYVYPGPQGEPVPKTFFVVRNKRVSNIPLAQLGFIVITVGQRGGSPLRTREYHNFGYGNARDYPLEDNKFAIEQLAEKYEFIDLERVGIYGRSGGGFMSAAAILVYPDFYKVAVSSCGNHDNNIYDYVWGELNYGIEKKITTNVQVAGNLKGRLLLIHGETDNNVHPANTFRLANELIRNGKRFDMMIFPGKSHVFDEYTSYIERMMWYYFAEHLLGDRRTNIDIYEQE